MLRIGLYAFLAYVGLICSSLARARLGILIAGAVGTFLAAAVANAIYCRGSSNAAVYRTMGLGWDHRSFATSLLGTSPVGFWPRLRFPGSALCCSGRASVRGRSGVPGEPVLLLFVTCSLLFGAFGEELLFRGYAFQTLVAGSGPFSALLPTSCSVRACVTPGIKAYPCSG